MDYFTAHSKILSTLENGLRDAELANSFQSEIFSIANQYELNFSEVGVLYSVLDKILNKELGEGDLFENLVQDLDLPETYIEDIHNKITENILTPLKKHFEIIERNTGKETKNSVGEGWWPSAHRKELAEVIRSSETPHEGLFKNITEIFNSAKEKAAADTDFVKIIKTVVPKLPEKIKKRLVSDELGVKFEFMGKMKNLTTEEIRVLEKEILIILLGLENEPSLEKRLRQNGWDPARATSVTKTTKELFFRDLDSELNVLEEKMVKADRETGSMEIEKIAGEENAVLEELNREDVLRDIENPLREKSPLDQKIERPIFRQTRDYKERDPYLEPID